MINIYNNDICPICGSTLIDNSDFSIYKKGAGYWYVCPNKCYSHMFIDHKFKYQIKNRENTNYFELLSGYSYTINLCMSKGEKLEVENAIKSEISYWRESERYLIKLMGG